MRRVFTVTVPEVKPTRNSIRPAARFGSGILPTRPAARAPFTFSDAAWWAAQQGVAEDRHFDGLADEAAFQDRYERGMSC